jgi:hypothetical protein
LNFLQRFLHLCQSLVLYVAECWIGGGKKVGFELSDEPVGRLEGIGEQAVATLCALGQQLGHASGLPMHLGAVEKVPWPEVWTFLQLFLHFFQSLVVDGAGLCLSCAPGREKSCSRPGERAAAAAAYTLLLAAAAAAAVMDTVGWSFL